MSADTRPLVVHVIHHLIIGGMENGLVNLVNRLPVDEFRHAIVSIEHHSDFAHRISRPDVEVIDLHRSKIGVWGVRRALYRLFRERQPRIVHSRNQSGLDALLPACLAGVPARVHGEHGWDVDNLDGSKRKPLWLRRLHAPMVNRYVTVSQHLQRYLVDCVGISGARVQAICNGVDTERFSPGLPSSALGLPSRFMEPDVLRVGTVGRLQPVKAQSTLIDAAVQLLARRPQLKARLRLLLVGDGPLRAALEQQAAQQGLAEITWFSGATTEVAAWMRALDVFVLPSLNEGISNTLLEAMASGLPVLATPVGGNVEVLAAGEHGEFFEVADAPRLSALLEGYLDDAALRQRHAAASRRRAHEQFSLEAMVAAYGKLYRELCD